ncbi:hypothetical protein ABIF68_002311 [Bradyrhizobium japonicum]
MFFAQEGFTYRNFLMDPRGSLQIPPGVVSQIPPPARQDKGLLV